MLFRFPGCNHFQGIQVKLTWTEARIYCQGIGGDLASFHTGEDDAILASLPG